KTFSFYGPATPRHLHSFPTRRSSDLFRIGRDELGQRVGRDLVPPDAECAGRDGPHEQVVVPERGSKILKISQIDYRGFEQPVRRSEEHTSELQSLTNLVCRLLLEKKN